MSRSRPSHTTVRVGRERPRVLFVHNTLTSFVRIDRDLLRARYDVEELAIDGRWTSPRRLWRAVRATDLVFCWFASAHSLPPALLGRLLRRPVIVVVGGYDTANMPEIGYGHQRGGVKKYVARATMRLATRLIANSLFSRDEAVREAGAPREKIAVVYHGVASVGQDDDPSPPTFLLPEAAIDLAPLPPSLPMEEGEDREPGIVLTVGNVDRANLRRKGLEPFTRAATLLPDLHFVLVGAWLDDAIDDLRRVAPPNVTFTGRLSDDELASLLRGAAIYVQASAHEGFGVALAEAMSAGRAPVVTRAGALPEVVGDAGVYAVSAEPDDLAAAITQAMARRTALGEAARARVATQFTLERRVEGLAGVIDAALTLRTRPGGLRLKSHGKRRRLKSRVYAGNGPQKADTPGVAVDGLGVSAPTVCHVTSVAGSSSEGEDVPFVSVVIPTRDEQGTIAACLEAVLRQEYPAGRMEVLVVDGRSRDRTRALVAELAAADKAGRVRLLDNPRLVTPAALNIGIRAARGAVIARVDGHTVIAPDYLRRCVEALTETGADNVGGLMRPRGHGYVGGCVALATTSRFGVGDARFHYDERGGAVDTVYLGCFRRAIFERVGLFDESLVRNQDDELNDRIVAAGGRIWLDPRIRSTYHNRGSLRALWRQYYQYGYWKVRVLRRHPHARRPRHLAPAALVAGLAGTAALEAAGLALKDHGRDRPLKGLPGLNAQADLLRSGPCHARGAAGYLSGKNMTGASPLPRAERGRWGVRAMRLLALAAWGGYGLASLAAGLVVAAGAGWRYLPGLLATFWTLHLGYGAGFMAALLAKPTPQPARIPRLDPRQEPGTGTDSEDDRGRTTSGL